MTTIEPIPRNFSKTEGRLGMQWHFNSHSFLLFSYTAVFDNMAELESCQDASNMLDPYMNNNAFSRGCFILTIELHNPHPY